MGRSYDKPLPPPPKPSPPRLPLVGTIAAEGSGIGSMNGNRIVMMMGVPVLPVPVAPAHRPTLPMSLDDSEPLLMIPPQLQPNDVDGRMQEVGCGVGFSNSASTRCEIGNLGILGMMNENIAGIGEGSVLESEEDEAERVERERRERKQMSMWVDDDKSESLCEGEVVEVVVGEAGAALAAAVVRTSAG
ncbi:hypothetical protein HK102_005557 [Quaeritorhiza haematococci]|nr:hypothetical protein HK102_005557 [Quaeritorhiza haematococci]